jgi:cytochrome c-type biogenesis protein CcmH
VTVARGAAAVGSAAAALIVLLGAGPAGAAPDDVANDISSEIMSPFCDGVTLHECPSAEALSLRARIEKWVRRGWTRDRIMGRLEQQYGASIRALPPRSGTGLVAWVGPAVALGAGALLAWARARRWSRRAPHARPAPAATAGERRRLERELAALRPGPDPGPRAP